MACHAIVDVDSLVRKRCVEEVRGVMTIDAILVIGIGWYVVREFTDADPIVVTGVAAA